MLFNFVGTAPHSPEKASKIDENHSGKQKISRERESGFHFGNQKKSSKRLPA